MSPFLIRLDLWRCRVLAYRVLEFSLEKLDGELAFLTGAGANDITFICPPDDEELKAATPENSAAAQSTEKCNGFFFALARNGPPNIVRVCPSFFDNRSIPLASR